MFKGMTLKIITVIVVTSILGEFRINPFDTPFRFGLGSAGFFFLLLLYKDIPYRLTGLLTGVFTTLFRVALDFIRLDSFYILESLQVQSPIVGYYFIFALALHMIKERGFLQNPIWLGLYGAFCDAFSNFVELIIISFSTDSLVFNSVNTNYILIIAMIRSFFVVGLYTIFQTNKLNAVYQEQRRRFEQVQTILSEMYIEVFYLKKTLHEIEEVTAKGHILYRNLKEEEMAKEHSILALSLTQELHEVKKDNQRILAGLEKVLHHEKNIIPIHLTDIIDLGIKSNEKYSEYLKKKVHFYKNQGNEIKIESVYPLLVIINNLLANAVEAIETEGEVKVHASLTETHLMIKVIDNGMGITDEEKDVIFEPGYTTKFDENGRASSGIGLSHVKSMVSELGGTIQVQSETGCTTFDVYLPLNTIQAKE